MERRRPARLDLADPMTKTVRRRDRPRERWLLTRKTWKYMSDAGRRLIPDGAQNRSEDVPRIEAYFQEVCQREPRFLLLRKSSYPGVLPKPRRKKRARGGSVRARSPPDDGPPTFTRPTDLYIPHTSGGRFDIAKLRRDFFAAPPPSPSSTGFPSIGASFNNTSSTVKNGCPHPAISEDDEGVLVDLLRKYLKVEENKVPPRISESEELIRALRDYLKRQSEREPSDSDNDPAQRILRENLGRYYLRSSNRDNTVQDLLSDRNLLRNLYHDLRKTKPYRGGRSGGGGGQSGFGPTGGFSASNSRGVFFGRSFGGSKFNDENYSQSPPMSPPPLIEVFGESTEDKLVDMGTQTVPISEEILQELERAYKEKLEAATVPTSPTSPPPERRPRRRSSVDHDDVSQSVSDTIKRYLRMARKKSVDADKTDRFKRINYDKNLRNIKPRQPGDVDDDGPNKGCQTDEAWILSYRDVQFTSVASTPTSPPSPSQSHSFLSTLLGRTATVTPNAGGMQKSRSSSSVVQSVSKRLWRTRSRSSSRVAAAWTPQGSCCWTDGGGRCVRLGDTSLLALSEVERRALQQAALARLQQLNLGTNIKIPENNTSSVAAKPKRRAHLLKRKAITTGFFDQRPKDAEKEKESAGSMFGVPLSQCVETERALRRQHGGSRASLASIGGLEKGDDSESCDSGEWGWSGVEEGGGGPRMPALVSACLAHLRRHGLNTIGLFRVSPSKKRVRQLREEWERCQEAALDAAVCPHDVATLLKEFLRDLPDPLLCKDLYPAFLLTQKMRNRRLQWEALRLLVQLLPRAHRDTLSALLAFLAQLGAHAATNKMDAPNVATILAPNILHRNRPDEAASAQQLAERTDVINVVRSLVEGQAELWALPAEMLHEAYIHLAHSEPAALDALLQGRAEAAAESEKAVTEGAKRLWCRESFLQAGSRSSTEGRRSRDSDASSVSLSSAVTLLARVGNSEDRASSGVVTSPPPDYNDSASDYNEACGASEDELVITASLHIPALRTRRRSLSSSSSVKRDSSSSVKRDSAVGSSSSAASPSSASASPPASPPPRPGDIDRLVGLARERHTSDSRAAVVGRQHDEVSVSRSTRVSRQEHTVRREEVIRREDQNARREDHNSRKEETTRREGTMLYKRGELISSARTPPA